MAQAAWRTYLELAYGMTEATTKKATKTVRRLVGKSNATAEQLQAMADDLLKAGSANREALTKLVRYELDRALGAVGLATADEVTALTARVHELEAQLKAATVAPVIEPVHEPAPPIGAEVVTEAAAPEPEAPPVAKKTVAKRTVAKRTAVEPVTPPPAQRVPVKRSAPAKQAAAKAAVTKVAAASDTPPARKTAAKAAPAVKAGGPVSSDGPASDVLPVKKTTRAPRKAATS